MQHSPFASIRCIAPINDFVNGAKAARAPARGIVHDAHVNAGTGGDVLSHASID
jgi:hypothetical protein